MHTAGSYALAGLVRVCGYGAQLASLGRFLASPASAESVGGLHASARPFLHQTPASARPANHCT